MTPSNVLLSFLVAASLSASACTISQHGSFYNSKDPSSSKGDGAENDAKGGGPKDVDPERVTAGLPATAAHASIAWYVR